MAKWQTRIDGSEMEVESFGIYGAAEKAAELYCMDGEFPNGDLTVEIYDDYRKTWRRFDVTVEYVPSFTAAEST